MRIPCHGELHPSGGPGLFLLARSEEEIDRLSEEYAGRVQLIYLDPPFGTGDTFHVRLGTGQKSLNLPVFSDTLTEAEYLAFLKIILEGCHRMLAPSGSLYLHVDYRRCAELRLMLNDIFGSKNFMNEIIWCYKSGGRSTRYFPRKHDNILFYRKSASVTFDITSVGKPRGPEKRNHMKRFIDDDGRICFSIRSGGKTYYYYEDSPVYPTDVWTDIEHLQQKDSERVGYATQKPEALLSRIILASSKPGDLVVDLFSGSGTTAAAAYKLKRSFLAVDASPFALNAIRQRQVKNAANPSLSEGASPMEIRFPDCAEPAGIEYDLKEAPSSTEIILKRAEFDGAYPIVYTALGTMEGDIFHPAAASFLPKLPLKLAAGRLQSPVIEITDAIGRRAFFTVG